MAQPRGLELLAPARDADTAREAILHGADAVYIGGPSHGARAAASNSIAELAELTAFAHSYGVRVYVTLNTIIFDNETDAVTATVRNLYRIGIDALIVQDMGLLRLDLPPIDLHASTQCDIRSIDKARFLAQCGFSQLVLPRELSLDQIAEYHRALGDDVKLEAFVHGALCVSYSGDCQASWAACQRSANRGECAQMCRLPYSLIDDKGNEIITDKHLLSLRDLNRITDLKRLADAGISSFKIEGRLKDVSYVKTVVAAYRQALDEIIQAEPQRYCRTSMGVSTFRFTPKLDKAFNRGFTSYFLNSTVPNGVSMANIDTPKWVGEEVGKVTGCQRGVITAKLTTQLNNGDGLGYFDHGGKYTGFRLNRIEGNRLFPASPIQITTGTTLYRNSDTRLDVLMSANTTTRQISVDMKLSHRDLDTEKTIITLFITDQHQHYASIDTVIDRQLARSPQKAAREKTLAKLGDTIYQLHEITDTVDDDIFIPLSALTALRRDAIKLLSETVAATYPYNYRRKEDTSAPITFTTQLTYHDNVANRAAEKFYSDHGARVTQWALETTPKKQIADDTVVMTTRYCLRRQLGACLKTAQGSKLPKNLYLRNKSNLYRLEFDCANCQMHLHLKR